MVGAERRRRERNEMLSKRYGDPSMSDIAGLPLSGFGFTLSEMGRWWCFERRATVMGCLVGNRQTRGGKGGPRESS